MNEQTKINQQDVYSVKTTPVVKDELDELLCLTGLSSKELFEAMVINYKIMALQGTEVERTEDVQQVRYHLSRVESLFMNLVQKNQDVKEDYASRIDQENMLHKQITDELQREKTLAIQEKVTIRAEIFEIIEQLKKAQETNVELTDRGRADYLTIDVLTNKTEELEANGIAIPKLEEQAIQLNLDNTSLQRLADGLQIELSKYKELLDSSQTRLSDISREREKAVQQAQEGALKDIDQLKYIHQLEFGKAVTEADKRVLEAINKTSEEYNSKLDSLTQKNDAISARNQDLVDRIHALELNKQLRD